jgi:hypothetical protein
MKKHLVLSTVVLAFLIACQSIPQEKLFRSYTSDQLGLGNLTKDGKLNIIEIEPNEFVFDFYPGTSVSKPSGQDAFNFYQVIALQFLCPSQKVALDKGFFAAYMNSRSGNESKNALFERHRIYFVKEGDKLPPKVLSPDYERVALFEPNSRVLRQLDCPRLP